MQKYRLVRVLVAAVCVAATPVKELAAADRIAQTTMVYAPPMVYGQWTEVFHHVGAFGLTIEVTPVGDTAVFGEVEYFDQTVQGNTTTFKRVRQPFTRSIRIRTANVVGAVKVRLKGVPTGTACRVTVSP